MYFIYPGFGAIALLLFLVIIVIVVKVFVSMLGSILSGGQHQPPITISNSDLFDAFKALLHGILEKLYKKVVRMAHDLHQFFSSLLTKGRPSPKTKCN